MKKGIVILMLVISLFHSIVLVPKAYCDVVNFPGAAARLFYRAAGSSPALAIARTGGVLLRVTNALGIAAIIAYELGAVDKIADWWEANLTYSPPSGYPGNGGDVNIPYEYVAKDGAQWNIWIRGTGLTCPNGPNQYDANSPSHPSVNGVGCWVGSPCDTGTFTTMEYNCWNLSRAYADSYGGSGTGHWYGSYVPPPSSPTDPGEGIYLNPPTFTAGEIYASSSLGAINGTESAEVIASGLSSSDMQNAINQYGLVEVDPTTGATEDQSTIKQDNVNLSMLNKLESIRQNTQKVAENTDNLSVGLSSTESQKLTDMVNALNQANANDNAMSAKIDNVATGVSGLSQSSATQSNLQSRIQNLKNLCATKFPFSLASAYTVTVPTGGDYSLGGWELVSGNPLTMINISPLTGPLSSLFTWVRQLLVYMLWVLTAFGMIQRVTQL